MQLRSVPSDKAFHATRETRNRNDSEGEHRSPLFALQRLSGRELTTDVTDLGGHAVRARCSSGGLFAGTEGRFRLAGRS